MSKFTTSLTVHLVHFRKKNHIPAQAKQPNPSDLKKTPKVKETKITYQGIIDVFDQEEANQFVEDFHGILSQILAI